MAAPLKRLPLEDELRDILRSRNGVRDADRLRGHGKLAFLSEILIERGMWTHGEAGFGRALSTLLTEAIDVATETGAPEGQAEAYARALKIDFALEPVTRIDPAGQHVKTWLTSALARADEAATALGETRTSYYHDKAGTFKLRTILLRQIVAQLSTASEQTGGSSSTPPRVEAHPSRLPTRIERNDEFTLAWSLLDACRTNALRRSADLDELRELADRLEVETDMDEARALVEFSRYEGNRGLETYRLVQGVTLLEAAVGSYTGAHPDLTTFMRLMLMREWANLFLTGDQVPGERTAYLTRVVELADDTMATYTIDIVNTARLRVAIGEALKEMAMVTHDATLQQSQYLRARAELDGVLAELDDNETLEAKRLVAQAKRHAAITYELAADKEADDDKRYRCVETWNILSEEAAQIAGSVGDDFIRAYSLLNAGSSQSRLTKFHGTRRSKLAALELGKTQLDAALPLLQAVNDDRGQGWVYIHLCENTEQRANLEATTNSTRVGLLRELEAYANHALAHLKHLQDHLGLTLAYLHLGKALYLLHEETGTDPATNVRLDRAAAVLSLAMEMTQDIGYFQDAMTTSRWLSQCLHNKWTRTDGRPPATLVKAIKAQITGLCECYAGQGNVDQLHDLFRELERRLDGELHKHR